MLIVSKDSDVVDQRLWSMIVRCKDAKSLYVSWPQMASRSKRCLRLTCKSAAMYSRRGFPHRFSIVCLEVPFTEQFDLPFLVRPCHCQWSSLVDILAIQPIPCPVDTCHRFTWHPGWPSLTETFPCSSQAPDARYPNHPICLSGLLSIEASFAWKKCIAGMDHRMPPHPWSRFDNLKILTTVQTMMMLMLIFQVKS